MENLSYQKKLQYLRELANGDSIAIKLIDAIKSRGKKELCQAAEQVILMLNARNPPDDQNVVLYHVKKMVEHLNEIVLSDMFRCPQDDSNFTAQVKHVQDTLEHLADGLGWSINSNSTNETKSDRENSEMRRYKLPELKPHQILTEERRRAVVFNMQHFLPKEIQRDIQSRPPMSFYRWRSRYLELQKNQNPPGTTKHNININREGSENFYWVLKSTPREVAAELFEGGLVRIMEIEAGERLKEFPSRIYQSLDKERVLNPHKDLMLLIHSTPPEWNEDIVWPSYHLVQVVDRIGIPNPPGCVELSPRAVDKEFISKKKAKGLADMYFKLQRSSWTTVAGTSRIIIQKKLKRKERRSEQELREEFGRGILEATHDMSDLAREMLMTEMEMHKPKKDMMDSSTRAEIKELLG